MKINYKYLPIIKFAKMFSKLLLFSLLYNTILCLYNSIPFHLCRQSDENLNECLRFAIQNGLALLGNGLPQYQIPSIQPIIIPEWIIPAGPFLNYTKKYTNWKLYNYHQTIIKHVKVHIDDVQFCLVISTLNKEIIGVTEYNFKNAFIDGVDVSGQGSYRYIYNDIEFEITFKGKTVQGTNKERILYVNTNMTTKGIRIFHSEFRSNNSERAIVLSNYFNRNWPKFLLSEKGPYEMAYGNAIQSLANSVLSKFSFDDLFPQ